MNKYILLYFNKHIMVFNKSYVL